MTKQDVITQFLQETAENGSVGRYLNKSFSEYSRRRDNLAMSLGLAHDIDPREFMRAETDALAAVLCK